jgi:hypothetical protein
MKWSGLRSECQANASIAVFDTKDKSECLLQRCAVAADRPSTRPPSHDGTAFATEPVAAVRALSPAPAHLNCNRNHLRATLSLGVPQSTRRRAPAARAAASSRARSWPRAARRAASRASTRATSEAARQQQQGRGPGGVAWGRARRPATRPRGRQGRQCVIEPPHSKPQSSWCGPPACARCEKKKEVLVVSVVPSPPFQALNDYWRARRPCLPLSMCVGCPQCGAAA